MYKWHPSHFQIYAKSNVYCMKSFMFFFPFFFSFFFFIAVITSTFKIEAMFICFNTLQIFIFKESFRTFQTCGNWKMFHTFARIFYVLFHFSLFKSFSPARSWVLYSSNIPNFGWILWNWDGAFPCFSFSVDSVGIQVYNKFVPATCNLLLETTMVKKCNKTSYYINLNLIC